MLCSIQLEPSAGCYIYNNKNVCLHVLETVLWANEFVYVHFMTIRIIIRLPQFLCNPWWQFWNFNDNNHCLYLYLRLTAVERGFKCTLGENNIIVTFPQISQIIYSFFSYKILSFKLTRFFMYCIKPAELL